MMYQTYLGAKFQSSHKEPHVEKRIKDHKEERVNSLKNIIHCFLSHKLGNISPRKTQLQVCRTWPLDKMPLLLFCFIKNKQTIKETKEKYWSLGQESVVITNKENPIRLLTHNNTIGLIEICTQTYFPANNNDIKLNLNSYINSFI